MYNENQKRKFIEQYTSSDSSRKSCIATFKVMERYENEWGADLCTKTAEELKPAMDGFLGLRVNGRATRIATLKAYAQWCMDNNIDGACDGIMNIDIEGVEKIKEQMVNSPLHLQKYLDIICCDESYETMDDVCRCFLWLAFAGCPEEEILHITSNDVDFGSMIITSNYSGKTVEYPIYRESIRAFKNCVELDQFTYIHPNYSKEIRRQRVPGNQLLRGIKSGASLSLIRVDLSKRAKKAIDEGKTKIRLSYYRAWLSGVFYRTHELEMIGVEPDFSNIASDFMQGKVYKLSSGRNLIGAKKRRVEKGYRDDYNRWKLAFFS